MALATNIVNRPGSSSYYVRIKLPGEKQRWISLRTASPTEARLRAPRVIQLAQDEYLARKHSRELVEDDVAAIAWKHYSELVENDERFRDQNLTDEQLDELWRVLEAEFGEYDIGAYQAFADIRDRIDTYKLHRERSRSLLTSGDPNKVLQAVAESVDEHVAAYRAVLPKSSPTYRKMAMGIARAEIEALKRADERDVMDWGGAPTDPMIKRAEKPNAAPAGSQIMDLYSQFERNKGATKKSDTNDQNRKIVQLFAEFVGETLPVTSLTRRHISSFRDQLALFPKYALQIADFKGLKFREIIAKNRDIGRPALDDRSINKYLSAVSPFIRWLGANSHIDTPILTEDLFHAIDTEARKYKVFSSDQLKTLFSSPLFRGCLSDTETHKPGNVLVRDWRYWLPVVALFTGARLGEIAQLLVEDVRQIDGIWCAYVTAQGDDGKSIKTANSRRVIPIHPELEKLGFLKFHEAQKRAGQRRLFPEIKLDARGHWGVPSKELNRYMDRIGLKEERLVVHSFRHLFTDRLRIAGHLNHEFSFILGHGDKFSSMTGHYGSLPQGTAQRRLDLVRSVRFDELDLVPLRPTSICAPEDALTGRGL